MAKRSKENGKYFDSPYFTKTELAKEFGYSGLSSFVSSKAHGVMMDGVHFIVSRVEEAKDREINALKAKIREIVG